MNVLRFKLLALAAMVFTGAGPLSRPAGAQTPCETGKPFVFRAGLADETSAPPEAALRGAALSAAFPRTVWKDFDDRVANRGIGHTFTDLPAGIVRAELELRLLPHSDLPENDSINIGLLESNRFAAGFRIADLPEAVGAWSPSVHGATTFTIRLGPTHTALLARMSSQSKLDVYIQDDTAADYLELRVWTCPPPVAAAGLLHQSLGNAVLDTGAHGLTVSNVGASGEDGVRIDVGLGSLIEIGLDGLDGAPAGACLDLRGEGEGPGLAGRLQREPDSWSFAPDLAAAGASGYRVRVFNRDQPVGTFTSAQGADLHFSGAPELMAIASGGGWTGPGGGGPRDPDFGLECKPTETPTFTCTFPGGGTCQSEFSLNGCTEKCQSNGGKLTMECRDPWHWSFCWDRLHHFWFDPFDPFGRFQGDCLWIDYFGHNPFDPFGGLNISAVNTNFTVTDTRPGFAGVLYQAFGEASLHPTADGITVAGLGPEGEDGAVFDLNRAADARLSFAPLDPQGLSPDGAFLRADLTGSLNGVADRPLSTIQLTHRVGGDFDQLLVSPDFSALSAPTYRAEVYDNGALVASADGRTGPVEQIGGNVIVIWPVALKALPDAGFGIQWASDGTIRIPGGQFVTGDELRILPESNSLTAIDNLAGFALRSSGLPEITITSIQASSCLPVITRQPADVATAAGRPAAFSVAADSASPLTYRWRKGGVELVDGDRVSGAATAMLRLPRTVLSQTGAYDVVLSNACGSVVSAPASYRPGVALRSLLLGLGRDVLSLVDRGALSTGQGNGLSKPLLKALAFLQNGNTRAAANRVDVFVNRVNAFVRAGVLSSQQGQELADAARSIRSRLLD
ncbi:MAG TPA: immunoglobulin domain-containing protein [Thermoanaerobaculia bacterium]|nr:immunoglobulin domain-containing protein [Thermoanaerobaculia bacterium]